MKILILDPSPVSCEIIKKQLTELSTEISVLNDEDNFLELYSSSEFHLVILAMQLKHSNAIAFLIKIQRDSEFIKWNQIGTKFILISSDAQEEWNTRIKEERIDVLGFLSRVEIKDDISKNIKKLFISLIAKSRKQVLVVDDSEINRKLMGRILKEAGIHMIEANDGSQALIKLEECRDDIGVVISDNYMRLMNGIELFEKMQMIKDFKKIPFILISGDTDLQEDSGLDKKGIKFYLTKPYTPDTLLFELSKCMLFAK